MVYIYIYRYTGQADPIGFPPVCTFLYMYVLCIMYVLCVMYV